MNREEDYSKVIELLEDLKKRISEGRIRFSELGADLIAELVDAGFDSEYTEDEKKAHKALIAAYVQQYNTISCLNNRSAEVEYFETLICTMRSWMLLTIQTEKEFMERIKCRQAGVLPEQMATIEDDKVKHIRMDVREIFLQQNADLFTINYQRLDVVVKYLAIENYYGKNNYGFSLYQKLQALRSGQSENMPEQYEIYSRETFNNLIHDIEKNGWDDTSEISLDNRLFLADGAHRLAASLYFGVPEIRVQVIDEKIEIVPFSIEYLRDGGFTEAEISIIQEKARELVDKCKVNISCILWPPVEQYFNQITEEIAPGCKYKDYIYTEETFPRIVHGIYHIDDIAEWKIQMKIDAMKNCPVKKIRVIELEILAPCFRLKQLNGNTISVVGEKLKEIIRNKYSKLVENYVYDIVIHTGDNFKQSEYIMKLFEPVISLRDYFSKIQNLNYFLIKHETPYMPKDFPESYAFSKDIDIICAEEDYLKLKNITEFFLQEKVSDYEVRKIATKNGMLFRIELKGFLIIQLDLGIGVDGICQKFWKNALNKKVEKDGYYLPDEEDEVCIRVNEYIKQPNKKHHLEYLKEHRQAYNQQYILENVKCKMEQLNFM